MATPHELYRGKAPVSMARMGEGIADAYAKAGAIEGQAKAQLGQTIGSAMTSVASMYAQGAQAKADMKGYESMMKSPSMQKMMGMSAADAEGFTAMAKASGNTQTALKMFESFIPQQMKFGTMQAENNYASGRIWETAQAGGKGAYQNSGPDIPIPTLDMNSDHPDFVSPVMGPTQSGAPLNGMPGGPNFNDNSPNAKRGYDRLFRNQ
jgi:hypothetical protein